MNFEYVYQNQYYDCLKLEDQIFEIGYEVTKVALEIAKIWMLYDTN